MKNICKKIEDYKKRDVKEPGTKTGLIEPLFKNIGWDFSDIDSVEPEYPVVLGEENKPVNYALKIDGRVSLFVEAKRIKKLATAKTMEWQKPSRRRYLGSLQLMAMR